MPKIPILANKINEIRAKNYSKAPPSIPKIPSNDPLTLTYLFVSLGSVFLNKGNGIHQN